MRINQLLLIFFITIKFTLQYIIVDSSYELHRDEFLHLDQAEHLAMGYLSVPPFTSWTSLLIKWLGGGIFWVRFFPALFGAITIGVVWELVRKFNGGLYAQILAASGLIFSALLRLNILYQPNSADILFWTLCYFYFIQYIQTDKNKYLYGTAVFFALGMLNKYNMLFWAIGMAPAILLTIHRNIFLKKSFYFSLIIGILIFLPNLLWQIKNEFPVIKHMQELTERQLVNVTSSQFIKEQFLFFIGSFFIWVSGFIALLFYTPFAKYRIIGFSFLFTMGIYLYLNAKAYYALGLYPVLFAFGAVFIENKLSNGWAKKIRYALPLIPLLILIPVFTLIFPLLTPVEIKLKKEKFQSFGLLRWEDGRDHDMPQDFADMLGWKELAAEVDKAYAISPEKNKTLVFCDNYGQAGAINYYSKNRSIQAVSFNADYKNWFPWEMEIQHVIRVFEFEENDSLEKEKSLFETVEMIGSVKDSSAREFKTTVVLLKNAKVNITELLRNELNERK